MNKLEKIDYINMLAQMSLKARIADDMYEIEDAHYAYEVDDIVEDVVDDLTSELDFNGFNYDALRDGAEVEVRNALDVEKLDEIAYIEDWSPSKDEREAFFADIDVWREALV